jgi:hypothetical protein
MDSCTDTHVIRGSDVKVRNGGRNRFIGVWVFGCFVCVVNKSQVMWQDIAGVFVRVLPRVGCDVAPHKKPVRICGRTHFFLFLVLCLCFL